MESVSAMAGSTSSINILAPFNGAAASSKFRLVRNQSTSCILSVAPASGTFLLQRSGKKCSVPLSLSSSRPIRTRRVGWNVITSQATSEDVDSIGAGGIAAIAGGLLASPTVWWSLYTLKTTGCGLPPGPGGSIGAIEGVSYLVIFGVIGWSIYTKVKTGSGLPQGPFGLLGAVEGISYLSLLAIVVVFGLQALDFGFIPGPLPGKECFG